MIKRKKNKKKKSCQQQPSTRVASLPPSRFRDKELRTQRLCGDSNPLFPSVWWLWILMFPNSLSRLFWKLISVSTFFLYFSSLRLSLCFKFFSLSFFYFHFLFCYCHFFVFYWSPHFVSVFLFLLSMFLSFSIPFDLSLSPTSNLLTNLSPFFPSSFTFYSIFFFFCTEMSRRESSEVPPSIHVFFRTWDEYETFFFYILLHFLTSSDSSILFVYMFTCFICFIYQRILFLILRLNIKFVWGKLNYFIRFELLRKPYCIRFNYEVKHEKICSIEETKLKCLLS